MKDLSQTSKVLVVGDTHGDFGFWRSVVIPQAKKHRIDTILQLGDFGYWEHLYEGIKYLTKLDHALWTEDLTVYWIDGNHENHSWLHQVYKKSGPPEPTRIRDRLVWLPRGAKIEIGGRKFLACGGAYSIDKPSRLKEEAAGGTKRWWAEEAITGQDVKRCESAGKADVLLSHDCPLGVSPTGESAVEKMDFPDTVINRHYLTQVMKTARVELVLHGHWHAMHDDRTYDGVRVVGLACNTNWKEGAMAILELPSLQVYVRRYTL